MIPAPFDYFSPGSLQEAIDLLSSREDAKVLAGGQSLVPLMKLRLAKPRSIIDLSRIPDLGYIREQGNGVAIGAMTTHAEIEASDLLRKRCPLLPQTAMTIADVQVRNQGTIGGSIAHADPAGDIPAAVLALDAEIRVVGPKGERVIKAGDFFLGLLMSALEPDEILTEILVPAPEEAKTAYLKAAPRASGFAVVGVAVCLKLGRDGTCREIAVGVTGVGDRPYRAESVEKALTGSKLEPKFIREAAAQATAGTGVVEDINGSKEYRSHLAQIYVARAVEAAMNS